MHLADDADILASQLHLDGHHARLLGDADACVTASEAAGQQEIYFRPQRCLSVGV